MKESGSALSAESLSAFVAKTEERVTGHVKMKLYKGNIIKAGTTSDYTLYSESLASFTTGDLYDHKDASGFITCSVFQGMFVL